MKTRRSDRLIDMTRYLLERPHTLISLTFFSERYESAKSSISEDLAIIKRTFKFRGIGILETIPGAAGGARFIPSISEEETRAFIDDMTKEMSEKDRLLPGGYVYLSDLLGRPDVLRKVGRVIARQYIDKQIDAGRREDAQRQANRCRHDGCDKRRSDCAERVQLFERAICYRSTRFKNY